MVFEAYVYSLHILGEKFAWERHLVERECELLIDSQCWVVLLRCAGSLTYVSELYFHQVLCDCAHGSLRVMDTYTSLTIRRKGCWFSMLEKITILIFLSQDFRTSKFYSTSTIACAIFDFRRHMYLARNTRFAPLSDCDFCAGYTNTI